MYLFRVRVVVSHRLYKRVKLSRCDNCYQIRLEKLYFVHCLMDLAVTASLLSCVVTCEEIPTVISEEYVKSSWRER